MDEWSDIRGLRRPDAFAASLPFIGPRPLIACHHDADGLSAGVIMMKALQQAGCVCEVRIVGKGENAYSAGFAAELEQRRASSKISGLVLADLGVSRPLPVADLPTIIIDHHVPTEVPNDAMVISGVHDDPIPTSSLLAYRAASALVDARSMLWLAAIGIIGDMAENSSFEEMEAARSYGITALRKLASLVNAPRRSASGDATPAFQLLAKADGPKHALSSELPETAILVAAQGEVRRETELARKAAPKVVGEVALIQFSSPCQVHPVIAQTWSRRLKTSIVIAANTGYREGWVHFAARSTQDVDLPAFLDRLRPPGADENYGRGHRGASGGALRLPDWNHFIHDLGFALGTGSKA
jgi:single-stranded-DNA-specific exonuclease